MTANPIPTKMSSNVFFSPREVQYVLRSLSSSPPDASDERVITSTPAAQFTQNIFNSRVWDNASSLDMQASSIFQVTDSDRTVRTGDMQNDLALMHDSPQPRSSSPKSIVGKPPFKQSLSARDYTGNDIISDTELADLLHHNMLLSDRHLAHCSTPKRSISNRIAFPLDKASMEALDLDMEESGYTGDEDLQNSENIGTAEMAKRTTKKLSSLRITSPASSGIGALEFGSATLRGGTKKTHREAAGKGTGGLLRDSLQSDRKRIRSSSSSTGKAQVVYGERETLSKQAFKMRGSKGSLIRHTSVKVNSSASSDEIGI